jgi:hypothetical protein
MNLNQNYGINAFLTKSCPAVIQTLHFIIIIISGSTSPCKDLGRLTQEVS